MHLNILLRSKKGCQDIYKTGEQYKYRQKWCDDIGREIDTKTWKLAFMACHISMENNTWRGIQN